MCWCAVKNLLARSLTSCCYWSFIRLRQTSLLTPATFLPCILRYGTSIRSVIFRSDIFCRSLSAHPSSGLFLRYSLQSFNLSVLREQWRRLCLRDVPQCFLHFLYIILSRQYRRRCIVHKRWRLIRRPFDPSWPVSGERCPANLFILIVI